MVTMKQYWKGKRMIDPNINPHEAAVEELERARAEGARFASDEEIVVLADLHPCEPKEMPNPVRGCKLSLFPMKKEC